MEEVWFITSSYFSFNYQEGMKLYQYTRSSLSSIDLIISSSVNWAPKKKGTNTLFIYPEPFILQRNWNLHVNNCVKLRYLVFGLPHVSQSSAPREYVWGEAEFCLASKATFAIWYLYLLLHDQSVKTKLLFGIKFYVC